MEQNAEVLALIKKAAQAEKSEDAMRFSQAANNAANTLLSLAALAKTTTKAT